MDQNLASLRSEEMTEMLKKALINKSLLQNEVLDEILAERDKAIDEARKKIQGICYSINYKEKKLKVFDTYTNKEIASVNIPGNVGSFNPDDFDSWGTSTTIIDLEEIQKEGDIPFHLDNESYYGLAVRDNKSYLYNSEIEKQTSLAITNQFIFGGIAKNKNVHLPFDMYLSSDNKILCLSNRDEGKVHVFNTDTNTFTDEIQIRQAGSLKSINVSIASKSKKIYLTDNITPVLYIYDLNAKKLDKKSLNSGVLGNICLTPDESSFYVVTIKPEPNLKSFDANSLKELKAFPPKGEYFSNGDDPCDLLTLSSDEKYIFSMTYLNDPMPFTPVLTVIDLEKSKAIKRFSIKDETKPITISFRGENPLGGVNKTLEELLVEKGLFTYNKLRDIKLAIMQEGEGGEEENKEGKKEEEFLTVETQALEFETRKDEPVSTDSGIEAKKVKHIILPKNANKHIMEILLGSFWQRNEIDLAEIPEAYKKLEDLADRTRKKLEYFDREIVNVKRFYESYTLESTIQREFILEMLDEEESVQRQEVKSAPSNCSNCGAPMLGLWECMACGFSYEKPEDALRRKQASLDPLANLNKGNFIVIDPESGLLLEVDNYKVPIWEMQKDVFDLGTIDEAVRLDNRNTLVLDSVNNTIIEVTPKGRTTWKYTPENEESAKLNNPKGMSVLHNNDLLIADTDNHRVVEMDFDGSIIWQYGMKGTAGIDFNMLNSPTSFQKTYDGTYLICDSGNNRIIEIRRELNAETGVYQIRKDWQFGNPENKLGKGEGSDEKHLNKPLKAFKQLDNTILILDNGNKRVLEVDEKNEMKWEYKTTNENPEFSIENPIRASKLKNKDLLVVGDGKMVQVFFSKNEQQIIWASTFQALSEKTTYKITKESITKTKVGYGSSSRYGSKFDNENPLVKEKREEKKKALSNRYMGKASANKKAEELEEKKELLDEIIENSQQQDLEPINTESGIYSETEEIQEAEVKEEKKVEENKPRVILAKGETLISIPVLVIEKTEKLIYLMNRDAKISWTYGENQELNNPKSVEITPFRTLLVSDDTSVFELNMSTKEKIYEHSVNANSSVMLKNGNLLICDEKNSKVYEITKSHDIVWEYYCDKPANYAIRLSNGNTLITCSNHIVKEVNSDYDTVWSFGEENKPGNDNQHLAFPEYAIRLKNGNTLITDTKNGRVIEVSIDGNIDWTYTGFGLTKLITPNFAHRLKDGHTFIAHTNHKQIIEVDQEGKMIWRLIMPNKK
ncbi:MAG: hypothetical protein U0354_02520 [Candidatus Sericytochromatia bacterium]